jgi:uncharacterized protein YraI
MSKGLSLRSERGCSVWAIVGWVLLVAVGVTLAWYGFTWEGRQEKVDSESASAEPTATAATAATAATTPLAQPTAAPTLIPTDTPAPTLTPTPSPIPPTPTTVVPNIVAGADGANVRAGPGTNFTRLGYLDPGTQVPVIGRYSNWWQIQYEGEPAWVYSEIVTPFNVDDVSQVQPPPSPTPVPPTATPTPAATATPAPTATPGPSANFRGLVPNGYEVEGAPGPYGAGGDIWFNMDITNSVAWEVEYNMLGTWVQETGQFQQSWTDQAFKPNQHFTWRDRIRISNAGTYNLWMRICFTDGVCVNLMGPVAVEVQ